MPTSAYDDRIVRMGFDNAKFEAGASKTMSTLDKLNSKLRLQGAVEGSENVQKAVDSVDFSAMSKGIEAIEKRFSTLGIVSMNVINKITDGITNSVKSLEQATIGQIKSGGWNRAMNIANAKFQIEGLGFAWEQVEEAVSYGVKDTAYGLDAAASAASQLAASGVDFQKTVESVNGKDLTAMHKSLRAISGVAAMTNSSYEDISRIFTTVAGNGRLMGDQLLQLSSRGMNAAAKLADVLNTTEADIREMVSRGQIDFQTFAFAMDDAFGEHAKEANKTFKGALDNMKAALSRVGEVFTSPIINKTNTLFISLTSRIDEFKNKLKEIKVPYTFEEIKKQYGDVTMTATAYDQIIKSADEKTVSFSEDFAKMWNAGIEAFSAMIKAIDIKWFDKIVEKVDTTTNKITDFFNLLKEAYSDSAEEAADGINDATKSLLVSAEEAQAAKDIINKGMYGSGDARKKALIEMFGGGEIGEKHAANVQAYVDSVVAAGWDFDKATIKIDENSDKITDSQEKMAREVKKAKIRATIDDITGGLKNLWSIAKNLASGAGKLIGSIIKAFDPAFKMDMPHLAGGFKGLTGALEKFSQKLIISDKFAQKITDTISGIVEKIKAGGNAVKNSTPRVQQFFDAVKNDGLVKGFKDTVSSIFDSINETFDKKTSGGLFDQLKEKFSGVTEWFSRVFESTEDGGKIKKFTAKIKQFIESLKKPGGLKNIFKSLSDLDLPKLSPEKVGAYIDSFVKGLKKLSIKDVAHIALAYQAITSIMKLINSMKNMTNIAKTVQSGIQSATKVPSAISNFFGSLSKSFKSIADAKIKQMSRTTMPKAILALAGALALTAAVILVLSHIEPNKVATAGITMATIMILLTSMVVILTREGAKLSKEIGGVKNLVPMVLSLSVMIGMIAGAVLTISIAARILAKAPVDAIADMSILIGVILGGMYYVIKNLAGLNAKGILAAGAAMTLIMNSMSGMFLAIALAVGMMKNVQNVEKILLIVFAFMAVVTLLIYSFLKDYKDFGYAATSKASALSKTIISIALSVVLIAAAVKMVKDIKNIEQIVVSLVGSLILIAAMVYIFADKLADKSDANLNSRIRALTSAILIISVSMNLIAAAFRTASNVKNLETTALTMMASLAAIAIMIGLFLAATEKDKYDSYLKTRIKSFTSGIMSIVVALNMIAIAFRIAGSVKNLETTALTMIASLGAVALIVALFLHYTDSYDSSIKQRIAMFSIVVVSIGSAMVMIGQAMAKVGKSDHPIAGGLMIISAIAVIGEILIAFETMTKEQNTKDVTKRVNSLSIAFTAIGTALLLIAMAMRIAGKAQNLETSALMLAGIIGAITVALIAFSALGAKNSGGSGTIVEIAAAFIIVALAISILANALKKLDGMQNGILSTAIAFGVFVGAIIVLGALAAIFPAFEKGMTAVGKAFLYAGAGAVLVGAGIFLVSKGIEILAPAVAILAAGLKEIFAVINDNIAATIVVGIIVLAIIAAATIAIIKLAPVLQAIAETISSTVKAITGSLNKGTENAKSWISNLSTKGKAAIAALIVTFCAAIMKASPEVLDTIGKLILKVIAFLASIVGSLAFALVDFLCKLIYAVADAIRMNRNKITNGLIVILLTLVDLILTLFKQVIGGIATALLGERIGNKVNDFFDGISEGINKYIDDSKAAAIAADEATEGYAEAMGTLSFSTSNFTDKAGGAWDSFTSIFKKDAEEQSGILDGLAGQYDDITEGGKKLALFKNEYTKDLTPEVPEVEVPDYSEYDDLTNGGKNLATLDNYLDLNREEDTEAAEEYSDEIAESSAVPDEYYQAMSENMTDGTQQAIKDSEKPTYEAVKTYINAPSTQALRENRRGMYESAEYCLEGAIRYFEHEGYEKYNSAITNVMREGQEAARKANEINSPSKVYYDMAAYMIAGLVNGIEQNTGEATDAMGGLSQAVLAAFGNPLDYIMQIANGDLAYDPSIRPVFDSSALYKGASSIDSMIAKQTVSVSGLSGRLAADISTLDNTNAEIVNELRALREDITVLGEEMADMKIVMDTGALVGATAGPMDKALGARSMRYGRG